MTNNIARGRQVVLWLENVSGGGVIRGDVVIVDDPGNPEAFTTTTSAALTTNIIGVSLDTINNTEFGRIVVQGYVPEISLANPASDTDYFLFTHTVAKQADVAAARNQGCFGLALDTGVTPSAFLFGYPDGANASGNVASDSIWDAKGDLAVATAANTAAVLTAGANGLSLITNSAEATGLKWEAINYGVADGRLTLTTGVPVTTGDVTGATTLYYTPYVGGRIGLYDGTRWVIRSFTEKSLSLVGYTASKPYDIFGYDNAGVLALESLIWTDGTTRATALAYQDGILVKSGDATRRYLGSIYINSSGGQTDDSLTKRCVWNYYNRCSRNFYLQDLNNHTYTTSTWRSWNNNTALKFEAMIGVSENPLVFSTSTLIETAFVGIGLDLVSSIVLPYVHAQNETAVVSGSSTVINLPTAGYHAYFIGEYGFAGGNQYEVYANGSIFG